MFFSQVKELGPVPFPSFVGERVYMREFFKKKGLPKDLSRWQPTVDALLEEVDTRGPIYLMVDQGIVEAGHTHRRAGVHIDGYWNPGIQAHGGGGSQHRPRFSQPERHGPYPKHVAGGVGGWDKPDFSYPEALFLASDVSAACAYVGEWEGTLLDGGDGSALDLSNLVVLPLEAGKGYVGNVSMLHESLPVSSKVQRSLIRLNVPGYSFH